MQFERLLETEAPAYGVKLSAAILDKCQAYWHVLSKWKHTINLTSISDPVELVRYHFLESMCGAQFVPSTFRYHYDLGSGAGFPAIPLRLLCPHLTSVLFESRQRRGIFLKELIRQLRIENISVSIERVNLTSVLQWPLSPDLITFRAIRFPTEVLEELSHQLTGEGRLMLWHGSEFPSLISLRKFSHLRYLLSIPMPHAQARYLSVFERAS